MCRTAFYNIHGITELRVHIVSDKLGATGMTELDKLGQNITGKTISQERTQRALYHINSVHKVSSHYSRAKSPHMKYLPPG